MKKYIIVLSAVIIVVAIIFLVDGKKDNNVSTEAPAETSDIIATSNNIPEALSYLPSYPETPKEVVTQEYNTGWKVEMVVPNAYAIAGPAWLTALREKGMNVSDVLEFTGDTNGPITWATVTAEDIFIRTSIATINDKETRINIYAKK